MKTVFATRKSPILCLTLSASLGLVLSGCSQQSSDTGKAVEAVKTVTENAALCEGFGPQTPRDISSKTGVNLDDFEIAPPASAMNLCNIHTHTNAEHKGPDFSIYAGPGASGLSLIHI